jgi:hypothetical protein
LLDYEDGIYTLFERAFGLLKAPNKE